MSYQALRGLLQSRLLDAGWADRTKWERKSFTPVQGQAYQDVSTRFAQPLPIGLVGSDQDRGEFQVRVLWPSADIAERGLGEAWARAEEIAALFPRNYTKTGAGGVMIKVTRKPTIDVSPAPQGDRDVLVVRVQFSDR